MTYREATLEQRASLVRRLAYERLDQAERDAIEAEIAAGDRARRAQARVHLPLVASARIASPCSERWDTMLGDGAARTCARCDREVFDFGLMTLAAAESLVRGRLGKETCARLHRRADGTMLFADCEVSARGVRLRTAGIAIAALAIGSAATAAANVPPPPAPRPVSYGVVFGTVAFLEQPDLDIPRALPEQPVIVDPDGVFEVLGEARIEPPQEDEHPLIAPSPRQHETVRRRDRDGEPRERPGTDVRPDPG